MVSPNVWLGKNRSKLLPFGASQRGNISRAGSSKPAPVGPAILLTSLSPNPNAELHCCSAALLRSDVALGDEIVPSYSQIFADCIELSSWPTETPVSLKILQKRNRFLWIRRAFHLEVLGLCDDFGMAPDLLTQITAVN